MKVTRHKRGYNLSLTDGEFEALELLVTLGIKDVDGLTPMTRGARRAINGRFSEIAAMRIDEDLR